MASTLRAVDAPSAPAARQGVTVTDVLLLLKRNNRQFANTTFYEWHRKVYLRFDLGLCHALGHWRFDARVLFHLDERQLPSNRVGLQFLRRARRIRNRLVGSLLDGARGVGQLVISAL